MDLIKIGRIGKTHGVKGELKISIEDPYIDDALSVDSLILKLGGQPLPFFIQHLRGNNNLLLKLDNIDDKETAAALQFLDIFLPVSSIHKTTTAPPRDQSVFMAWVGYEIEDKVLGKIGTIDFVHELPEHYLAEITIEDEIVVIPLHFDLVKEVDNKQKIILMELPEGILEVN